MCWWRIRSRRKKKIIEEDCSEVVEKSKPKKKKKIEEDFCYLNIKHQPLQYDSADKKKHKDSDKKFWADLIWEVKLHTNI